MRFVCRPVDANFLETAPWRFAASAEVPLGAREAFAILEDETSWPKFFAGIRAVEWTSPRPFTVGTTRTVKFSGAAVDEYFFRWESGTRFSFYLVATNSPLPLFRALAEDYLLEPLAGDRCRFTYTVAAEPSRLLRLSGPLGRRSLERVFTAGPASFARYVAKR